MQLRVSVSPSSAEPVWPLPLGPGTELPNLLWFPEFYEGLLASSAWGPAARRKKPSSKSTDLCGFALSASAEKGRVGIE